ncbi:MAG: hypothetical protein IJW20_05820 [Clostridia bacterium]|nr:hypothetical protein [Clostridia bacterium]
MGNDTKSLLISGAVCVVVLIISIGMFIYNNAASSTYEGMSKFTEQEVNTFNSKFTMYEGVQNGTTVKNLIAILVSNSTSYDDKNFIRLPQLLVNNNEELFKLGIEDATRPIEEKDRTDYIQKLTKIRNSLNSRKKYLIKMEYSEVGFIDKISIWDATDSI